MARVAAVDLEQALTLSGEWHAALSREELVASALAGLDSLIASDGVGWNEIDLDTGAASFLTEPVDYFDPAQRETLARLIDRHPIVGYYAGTADGRAVTISDLVRVRDFHRSELYGDLYRDAGVEDQLAFTVAAGRSLIGVAFSRPARSFTARDRTLLELLRPHLVSAHENLRTLDAARERVDRVEDSLEEDGRAIALIRDGRVEPLTAGADAILGRWFCGEQPPLPELGQPLVLDRGDRRLTLRRANGDTSLLLLDETSFAPAPERACELGLSRREAEVISLAARGLGNSDIATMLDFSVRTVEKHLEHAYRKLGVHSRTEAVARLLGRW